MVFARRKCARWACLAGRVLVAQASRGAGQLAQASWSSVAALYRRPVSFTRLLFSRFVGLHARPDRTGVRALQDEARATVRRSFRAPPSPRLSLSLALHTTHTRVGSSASMLLPLLLSFASLAAQAHARAVIGHWMGGETQRYTTEDYAADMRLSKEVGIDAWAVNSGKDTYEEEHLDAIFEAGAQEGFNLTLSVDMVCCVELRGTLPGR